MVERIAALLALACALAQPSHAQGSRGRIEGTVMDSVRARPLGGVRVLAVGEGSRTDVQGAATSDSAGRYRIDSLPVGRYSVGFESPLLDSLEIALSPRLANVAPEGAAAVDLALPSAAKLRAAVCTGVDLPPATGAIVGHVVSAETESPLPGVTIAMAWQELEFDRKTLRRRIRDRTASVVTDDAGWYRVCGVPTGNWLSMQVHHEGRTGPVLRAVVDDTLGVAVRYLSHSALSARPLGESAAASAESASAAPMSGTARLTGVVRGPGGAPVRSAQVRVAGTLAAGRTDSLGTFSLGALPAGTQLLEVRQVGYAASDSYVELRSGATTTSDVRLQRIVNLDSVRVVAIRARYTEFAEEKKLAIFGIFLDPEQIERQRVSYASDIIEKLPGFRIVGDGIFSQVVSGRGPSGTGACKVNIVIDGVHNLSINDVHPAQIGAIAAYREGEIAPETYNKGCGAIVIWTKRGH